MSSFKSSGGASARGTSRMGPPRPRIISSGAGSKRNRAAAVPAASKAFKPKLGASRVLKKTENSIPSEKQVTTNVAPTRKGTKAATGIATVKKFGGAPARRAAGTKHGGPPPTQRRAKVLAERQTQSKSRDGPRAPRPAPRSAGVRAAATAAGSARADQTPAAQQSREASVSLKKAQPGATVAPKGAVAVAAPRPPAKPQTTAPAAAPSTSSPAGDSAHSGGTSGAGSAGAAPPVPRAATRKPRATARQFSVDDFEIGKSLGKGKFGHVYQVRERVHKRILAMKLMMIDDIEANGSLHQLKREIEIHARLKHPNVIRFFACFKSPPVTTGEFQHKGRVHMVLEYANAGELFKIMKRSPGCRFSEQRAANYTRQLIQALTYLHSKGVIHRDLKPENLLLHVNKKETDPLKRETIKLADFGWSVVKRTHTPRMTMCGTLDYLPPEMVAGKVYDEAADIWAVGVMLYEFVVGVPPFETEGDAVLTYDKITAGEMTFPDYVSAGAQDLIRKLLCRDPRKRLPLKAALQHPWITNHVNDIRNGVPEVVVAESSGEHVEGDHAEATAQSGSVAGQGCPPASAAATDGSTERPLGQGAPSQSAAADVDMR